MKTNTIISACVFIASLAALPESQANTLLYGLDFNKLTTDQDPDLSLDNKGAGTTSIGETGGYINYKVPTAEIDTPLHDQGYSHTPSLSSFKINDDNGINGLSMTEGFSIGFHLLQNGNANNKDAITFNFGSTSIRMEKTNTDAWVFYGGGETLDGKTVFNTSGTNAWDHVGFTFKGNLLQIFVNGSLTETFTTTLANSKITEIKGGGSNNSGITADTIQLDNFAVYDGELGESGFKYLTNNAMTSTLSVPEPTTATLSLLSLIALMMRRRV
ncbi:MAG: LamG-like jellyroll fold domain-containing protein [Akkermansia sp.]